MPTPKRKPMSAFRRRLKRRDIVRVELHVRKEDAALVRGVAQALSNPESEAEARPLLREHFSAAKAKGLKALLAAAPLDGIDLTRPRARCCAVNYLIDTNIISEVRKGAACNPNVITLVEFK